MSLWRHSLAIPRNSSQVIIRVFISHVVLTQQIIIHKVALNPILRLVSFIPVITIAAITLTVRPALLVLLLLRLILEITIKKHLSHVFTRVGLSVPGRAVIEVDLIKVEAILLEAVLAGAVRIDFVVVHFTLNEAVVAASVLELAHVEGTANVDDIAESGSQAAVAVAALQVHVALIAAVVLGTARAWDDVIG